MTRAIDPAAEAAAAADAVRLAVLAELEFSGGTSRPWSGLGDFTWDGRTFAGVGDLLAISTVEETAEVRSVVVSLQLSGVPTSAVGLLGAAERWANRPARLWLAFFADDGATLQAEPVQIVRGRMDVLEYEEGETAVFKLSVESRLADLERPRIRRYTDADQQAEYPGDLGFQYVASVAAGVDVTDW